MIDVVYPLGNGSRWKNNELRYSLRSIEKYLSGFRNVYIIGEKPSFLQNVIHIPYPDKHQIPDRNIMEKVLQACNHPYVSDPFIFFNDDHYLLSPFQADQFPYYYEGTLKQKQEKRGLDGYGLRLKNTYEYLKSKNLPILCYDIHTPILYRKQAFIDHVASVPWDTTKHGFVLKSLYANAIKAEGVELKDLKLSYAPPPKTKIMSSRPEVKIQLQRFFKEQFPKMSKFESWDVRNEPKL